MAGEDVVNLTGVPETMLWTLHNRADEARRTDGFVKDDLCLNIYESIDYDYVRSFGRPDSSHGWRSSQLDEWLRKWIDRNDGGIVIELGAGLETQFYRVMDDRIRWYAVDVPEAMAVREKYIPAHERLVNIGKSALDYTWLDDVPEGKDGKAFVSMQGLLMYFREEDVRQLFPTVLAKYPNATLVFDVIPRWFSDMTVKGLSKTKHYMVPPMPWGISRKEIEPFMEELFPGAQISFMAYKIRFQWGGMYLLFQLLASLRFIDVPLILALSKDGDR
ncbi:hypothetical protein NDN08_001932 [Rhodosorus marinus]|uniref:Uncharacterized protein n=1 Tax=Rhodosorus marinus TaxID=101924 RepID=A0AAV8US83_9RHOD|nr:hypothetical protein NDN08_001932 [Rhodosorus marinus]